MANLSNLLRQHRQKTGLTQKQLAERINFSHSVISRVEKPQSGYLPSEDFVAIFCRELGLTDQEKSILLQALHEARLELSGGSRQRSRIRIPIWQGGILLIVFIVLTLAGSFPETEPAIASPSTSQYQQTPTGGILYANDFEDRDISNWKNLNNGRWGIFKNNASYALGVRDQDPTAIPNAYLLLSDDWVDYSLQVDVTFISGAYEQIYLVVRSARQPNCSGYRVGGNRLGVSIFRFDPSPDSCDGELLAEDIHFPLDSNQPYIMRVDVLGDSIRYYINNVLILNATDSKYSKGGLGFLAYQVKEAYFDDILITKLGH